MKTSVLFCQLKDLNYSQVCELISLENSIFLDSVSATFQESIEEVQNADRRSPIALDNSRHVVGFHLVSPISLEDFLTSENIKLSNPPNLSNFDFQGASLGVHPSLRGLKVGAILQELSRTEFGPLWGCAADSLNNLTHWKKTRTHLTSYHNSENSLIHITIED